MENLSYLLAGAVAVLAAVCCYMGYELRCRADRLTRLGYQKHQVNDERLRLAEEKRRLEAEIRELRDAMEDMERKKNQEI
jgi:hypothetical protein